jgi:hypothetical protein
MEFIPTTQAIQLKQLGFNQPCWAWYNIPDEDIRFCFSEGKSPIINSSEDWNAQFEGKPVDNIGLPMWCQAFEFFRDNHNLYISQGRTFDKKWFIDLYVMDVHKPKHTFFGEDLKEVELACLIKMNQMVENKQC